MVYIQSDNERTRAHHFDAACALYGAIDEGLEYKLISYEDLISGRYDPIIKARLFVGSVEFMNEVFSRIGKAPRVPINSNRSSEIMSLGEAKKRVIEGEELFIKPKSIKLFTGSVFSENYLVCLNPYPEDTEVFVYKPFRSSIESEWRLYIRNGKIQDARNYSGDFEISPDYGYIREVISEYRDTFPCCYTVDVGILKDGENVVVEFNDMWAIGNYGMENYMYLRMLRERYFEIIRL